ncbi:uncharacterized protein TNCV_2023041 [Trichonephila clavipes]|nr:uncharacterized protein TNCV_2023041 [Trichonephila clavipes]
MDLGLGDRYRQIIPCCFKFVSNFLNHVGFRVVAAQSLGNPLSDVFNGGGLKERDHKGSNVSRPTVWLREFPWPPSDQHMAITGTKAALTFIRKHNKSPLLPPMSSGLIPLQTAMTWSQWKTRYRAPGLELPLK